jgi:hypothetical protein
MRHWLLILMIALLPLRSWAGDAMALSMWATPDAPQATAPCHTAAAPMASVPMEGDSHHASAAGAMAHEATDSGHSPQHATCNACDVCNGPAMTLAAHSASPTAPVHDHVAPASERFASALPQRGSKPPIA